MDFFATTEQVRQFEADLAAAQGAARLPLLLALAWHLRQRDSVRALELAGEAEALLRSTEPNPSAVQRLALVRAEAAFLHGDFATAHQLAEAAEQGFAEQEDAGGCCDANWLRVCCAYDQNRVGQMVQHVMAMGRWAARADPLRERFGAACMAFCHLRNRQDDRRGWVREFGQPNQASGDKTAPNALNQCVGLPCAGDIRADADTHPGLRGWIEAAQGDLARQEGDHAMALKHYMQAHALALASEQIRLAQIAATHIGVALLRLDDYPGAQNWGEQAVAMARVRHWPVALGSALIWRADSQIHLQQLDAAHALLDEAAQLLQEADAPWFYALALYTMAKLELQRGQYVRALGQFLALEVRANTMERPRLLARARTGQAQALFGMQRPEPALVAAMAVVEMPNTPLAQRIDALCLLASIRSVHPECALPASGPLAETSALALLQQALQLAEQRHEHSHCIRLHHAMAEEQARLGRHDLAYQAVLAARAAHEQSQNREARNRALASQISYQNEQVHLEQQHHRQMAETEAARAALLQQSANTLEYLSEIGQDMIAHLEPAPVFQVLARHVSHLLDANALTLFLLESGSKRLLPVLTVGPQPEWLDLPQLAALPEPGVAMPEADAAVWHERWQATLAASSQQPLQALLRCCLEQCDVVQDDLPPALAEALQAGKSQTGPHIRSRLFVPLLVAGKLFGVLTAGSVRSHAYGAREQLILRTLAGYAAIALSNAATHGELAQAHQHLQARRQQMIEQGKMAGLGALIAGVAHEINNPVGFLHVAAQNLLIDLADFEKFLRMLVQDDEAQGMQEVLSEYFAGLNLHVKTMLNGTHRITHIVQDLRSFSRQNETERKAVQLSEILDSTIGLVRTNWQGRVEFVCEFIDDPHIECWPPLLGQVFMNLLVNGCQAIDEKQRSHGLKQALTLQVRLQQMQDTLQVIFQDTGIGIAKSDQSRILEPFFTTKPVGSGTGLGLSIAYGIVEKHGGRLSFESEYGVGSTFLVHLPLPADSVTPATGGKG